MKFAPKALANSKAPLVQIMALRRRGDIMWTNDGIVYWRVYVELGGDELYE